jgi:hypothetical protein
MKIQIQECLVFGLGEGGVRGYLWGDGCYVGLFARVGR